MTEEVQQWHIECKTSWQIGKLWYHIIMGQKTCRPVNFPGYTVIH